MRGCGRSCGFCSYQCPIASDVCCSGVCADLLTSSTNCGQCGFFCVSLPNIQACTPRQTLDPSPVQAHMLLRPSSQPVSLQQAGPAELMQQACCRLGGAA